MSLSLSSDFFRGSLWHTWKRLLSLVFFSQPWKTSPTMHLSVDHGETWFPNSVTILLTLPQACFFLPTRGFPARSDISQMNRWSWKSVVSTEVCDTLCEVAVACEWQACCFACTCLSPLEIALSALHYSMCVFLAMWLPFKVLQLLFWNKME